MTGTFALIGALIAMIIRANKEFGKIENTMMNYAHILLMVVAVLVTSFSLNIFFKLVLQYEATMQIMYIQNGFFSPILNATVWILCTVLNVSVLFAVMSVALRSEKARKILVALLPAVFLINTIKAVNEVIVASVPETSMGLVLGLAFLGMLITFAPVYFFYSNSNVKRIIFNSVS